MLNSTLLFLCLAAVSQDAAKYDFDTRENIVYAKVGEHELRLDAFVPKKDETYPAILVIHGGAWRHGNRKQLRSYAKSLAAMGFVCFAIDYRLAPEHKFPAQIDDCRAALKWVRRQAAKYKVDARRVGAIGYSAGGHLTALLATTGEAANDKNGNIDTRLQAAAAGGAPTDFRTFPDNGRWAEYFMGGDLDEVPEKFRDASPAAFVDASDPPIFFFNGTNDLLVPLVWTEACYRALSDAGVRTELYKVEGAGHLQAALNANALIRAYEFLKRELRDKQPK